MKYREENTTITKKEVIKIITTRIRIAIMVKGLEQKQQEFLPEER